MSDKIDLNEAGIEELAALRGIGLKLAQRIVTYRDEVHPFEETIELAAVPGISERMVRAIEEQVTVTAQAEQDTTEAMAAPADEVVDVAESGHAELDLPLLAGDMATASDMPDDTPPPADAVPSGAPSDAPALSPPPAESPAAAPAGTPVSSLSPAESPAAAPAGAPVLPLSPAESPAAAPAGAPILPLSPAESPAAAPAGAPILPLSPAESPAAAPAGAPVLPLSPAESPADAPALSPSPAPHQETAQSRSRFGAHLLTGLAGALLGMAMTLAILWLLNGSLRLNETASVSGLEQESSRAAATLQAGQAAVRGDLAQLNDQLSAFVTRESEAAALMRELRTELETVQGDLTESNASVAALETVTADQDERIASVAGSAARLDIFMDGLRDLLIGLQGLPDATATPAPTTDSASGTPTPGETVTPTRLFTRTPRPSVTPLGNPTATPTP